MALSIFVGGLRFLFRVLLLLVAAFAIGFLVFAAAIDREQREPTGSADGIAVLTGGKARIDEAMKLLSDGKAKRLLITGVYRHTSKETLMQLAAHGGEFFTCCVDIDKEAKNTIDNATETSQWVARHGYKSIIVVTSAYHMPRALAELGRVMPDVRLVPYPVVVNSARLRHWWKDRSTRRLLLREYVKFLPAVARLGATQLVSKVLTGTTTAPVQDASEP
jgi:uncharacterized SAM-binding protein YcdF (DUF218 family)